MSAQLDRIRDYIKEYEGDDSVFIESGTPADEAGLRQIAEAFSFTLPDLYREYLSTFGTLAIGGDEFAGASDTSHLNVIAARDELAETHGLPDNLIPIKDEDGDSYVCIRPDSKLVRWYRSGSNIDILDESLGDYLLRLCDELIEDEGSGD